MPTDPDTREESDASQRPKQASLGLGVGREFLVLGEARVPLHCGVLGAQAQG
jgi:hypothetical protein